MAAAEVVVLVATVAVAAAAVVTIHDRIKAGVHISAPFSNSSSQLSSSCHSSLVRAPGPERLHERSTKGG